jgi:SAM-dependent methyltransferase
LSEGIESHYTKEGLEDSIRAALRADGKDPASVSVGELAELDQLHVRGLAATRELAGRAGLTADTRVLGPRVLDVGCGIGGPSRVLASEFGCRVTGVDLTAAFCRLAAELALWVGLEARVDYRQADARALPFGAAEFDLVWSQHAAMNIAEKDSLYREMRRVLRPDGKLALYDILRGVGDDPVYPLPWARDPAISFLISPDSLREHLSEAGFAVVSWRDTTADGLAWFREMGEKAKTADGPPPGPRLFMGEDFAALIGNLRHNLEEGRLLVLEAVCRVV